jgi:DNA-binding CsgD family transcriptional regulator
MWLNGVMTETYATGAGVHWPREPAGDEALPDSPDGQAEARAHNGFTLTARETAILCLVAGGCTNADAGRALHISRHTVAQHIADMLRRADARNRGELVARAYSAGILVTDTWPPRARVAL